MKTRKNPNLNQKIVKYLGGVFTFNCPSPTISQDELLKMCRENIVEIDFNDDHTISLK
jgi:hypothetical protein